MIAPVVAFSLLPALLGTALCLLAALVLMAVLLGLTVLLIGLQLPNSSSAGKPTSPALASNASATPRWAAAT